MRSTITARALALVIGSLCSGLQFCALADESIPAFKDADEMVSGWYHRMEHDTWRNKGARDEVVEGILKRIENAEGERSDPELVDTISKYGPGNWVYEWQQAGEAAMRQARKAKDPAQATRLYREALAYFTTASWPHLGLDADKGALVLARQAYVAAGAPDLPAVQHLQFAVGDTTTRGYLHLPAGPGPFPVLVFTHGSDVTKEDALPLFNDELAPRGIALFAVDMPGIGEASHIPLYTGSDLVLSGAVDFMHGLDEIDKQNIFVGGASFGGNAAATFFLRHQAAGVISLCGPLHSPFMAPPEVLDSLPRLTIDGVKARVGTLGRPTAEMIPLAQQVSIKKMGLTEGPEIDTPLFIFTTNRDPVAPLDDLPLLEGRAKQVDKLVIDTVGHCPDRALRNPIIAAWVAHKIKH